MHKNVLKYTRGGIMTRYYLNHYGNRKMAHFYIETEILNKIQEVYTLKIQKTIKTFKSNLIV